jgi:hypothetical protein
MPLGRICSTVYYMPWLPWLHHLTNVGNVTMETNLIVTQQWISTTGTIVSPQCIPV